MNQRDGDIGEKIINKRVRYEYIFPKQHVLAIMIVM